MSEHSFDVILVGGGVMGCATAYYLLKADPKLRVAILEMDPTYARASSPLSDGNVRLQFNVKENIQISQYGLEVMADFAEEMAVDGRQPDIAFRRQGNLFLVDETHRAEAEAGLALQQSLGCAVEWLSPQEAARVYPLLAAEGYVGATFGPDDGTLDPWALLQAYKDKAIALGAQFRQAQAVEFLGEGARVVGVRLAAGESLMAGAVVASGGAWVPEIARTVAIDLPVQPVRRQVFVFETVARPDRILPLLLLPTGLYLIHENHGLFMCGKSCEDDPVGYNFEWSHDRFMDELWEELIKFIPAFDQLKITRGWSGLYAVNTFDGNAILGEWPGLDGLFLITGFSGHGLQQCHAVGRYIAELVLGQPHALDLSIFSPARIPANRPVFENAKRLI